jgi:hypothetical protein
VPGFFNQERGYAEGFHFPLALHHRSDGIGGVWLALFLQISEARPLVAPEKRNSKGRLDVATGTRDTDP